MNNFMLMTLGLPCVSVPVLSNTTVDIWKDKIKGQRVTSNSLRSIVVRREAVYFGRNPLSILVFCTQEKHTQHFSAYDVI